jgi:hypothetical protein
VRGRGTRARHSRVGRSSAAARLRAAAAGSRASRNTSGRTEGTGRATEPDSLSRAKAVATGEAMRDSATDLRRAGGGDGGGGGICPPESGGWFGSMCSRSEEGEGAGGWGRREEAEGREGVEHRF